MCVLSLTIVIGRGNFNYEKDLVDGDELKYTAPVGHGDRRESKDELLSNYVWGDRRESKDDLLSNYVWGDRRESEDDLVSNYVWGDRRKLKNAE